MSSSPPPIPASFQAYAHDGLLLSYGWRASGQAPPDEASAPITRDQARAWEAALRQQYRDDNALTATLAGLWLLWGDLDRSHRYSQSLATPLGSLWHAVMHRLEGDLGNSLYWYRRAGQDASITALRDLDANYPDSLVEACGNASRAAWVAQLACQEWRELFQRSTGGLQDA